MKLFIKIFTFSLYNIYPFITDAICFYMTHHTTRDDNFHSCETQQKRKSET